MSGLSGRAEADVGLIVFSGSGLKAGWLECDGSAISRTAYAALFNEIGVIWGEGDGSTTFNLPDIRAKFPRGLDNGRGIDVGRVMGSSQDATGVGNQVSLGANVQTINDDGEQAAGVISGTTGNTTSPTQKYKLMRPMNVASMYLIKY
jgi:microcystin-dependent protein